MADYSPTTWVQDVTKVGPTNLNKLEQGVKAAGKRASLVATTGFAASDDTNQIEWRRADNGALVAYKTVDAEVSGANVQVQSTEQVTATGTYGALLSLIAAQSDSLLSAQLYAETFPTFAAGSQASVNVFVQSLVSGVGYSAKLMDDAGKSDFLLGRNLETWRAFGASGQPAYTNGWSNYSPGVEPSGAFRKTPDGRVQLRGLIKGGTLNASMFTLPVGYRPVAASSGVGIRVPVIANAAIGYLNVNSDGTCAVSPGTSATWVSLDSVSFYTD